MKTIFIIPEFTHYYTEKCTFTYLIFIFLNLFLFIFPFIAGFASEKFWIRESIVYETPIINYDNEIVINLLDDKDNFYFLSTNKDLNALYENSSNQISSFKVSYSNIDTNYDDIIDKINVKIGFNMNQSSLRNFKIGMFLDYGLNNKVKFLSKDMIFLDVNTPFGIESFQSIGNINLYQKEPIHHGGISKISYYQSVVGVDYTEFDINHVYLNMKSRNISIDYDYEYFITFPDDEEISDSSKNEINIDITMNIPYRQKVLYIPSLLYTFKNAWVQYFSIFIPVWFFFRYLFMFLIHMGVFSINGKK